MINILIDGNYIFHKTFGVFAGYGDDVNPAEKLASKDDQAMFIRKVSMDLCYLLNLLPDASRIIFTLDNRSWRKEYYPGYKSRREEKGENSKDWSIFYKLMHSFAENLENKGFIFSKSQGAEGDDSIWGWNEHLSELGENCIIVSGDGDFGQLVETREHSWTILWNSKAKNNLLSIDSKWISEYLNVKEEITLFNMGTGLNKEKSKLKELLNKADVNIIEKDKFIFLKMLAGDKGDDVPSIWSYKPKPDSRLTRVTENKATKIWDLFIESKWNKTPYNYLLEDEEFLDWVAGQSIKAIKDVDSTTNREIAKENLIRNFDLMWLNETSYPSHLVSRIRKDIYRGMDLDKRDIIINRNKLLEGTEWFDKSNGKQKMSTPSEYDPFKLF